MGWACRLLGALAVGLAGPSHGFIRPSDPTASRLSSQTPLPFTSGREDYGIQTCTPQPTRRSRQQDVTVVYMSRRRGGRGGTWQNRRRRGSDAPPVEFDKYGFPLPPTKTSKEAEEEHQKWFQGMEPEEGYTVYDPASDGVTPEDLERDPFLESGAAEGAEGTANSETEGPEERVVDYENLPEWAGEMVGMDDPLDAPWRVRTEEIVRQAVADAGFDTYDVTWHFHHLNIDIANPDESAGSPTSDQITDVLKAVEEALYPHDDQLRVLQRYNIIIGTRGARDVLTTEREFNAFKGFEVYVTMRSPVNESEIQPTRVGRLVSRTPQFTTINVQGRNVKIPTDFIAEVRLPPAKREDDDFETILEDDDEDWGAMFANGKLPKTIDCEMEMDGLVSWDKGAVQMVEGDWYEPPEEEEMDGSDVEDEDMPGDFDIDDLDDVVAGDDD